MSEVVLSDAPTPTRAAPASTTTRDGGAGTSSDAGGTGNSAGINWQNGAYGWWCGWLLIVGRMGFEDYLGAWGGRLFTLGEDVLSWPVGRWASFAPMSFINVGDMFVATGVIAMEVAVDVMND